ncbi:MAG: PKD domain-containing protein [bacterium]|nr:PKD domain-containing protein [bacterium]
MKPSFISSGMGALLALLWPCMTAVAATNFVSLLGHHHAPFTTWSDAATNIQDAVNVARAGDVVLVSNGVYAAGVTAGSDGPTRVMITNAITLIGMAGPADTVIDGGFPAASNRCVTVGNAGALVAGFTLRNGRADYGGGIEFVSGVVSGGTLSNCLVHSCSAKSSGGGIHADDSEIVDCIISNNTLDVSGGGAGALISGASVMRRCTVTRNRVAGIFAEAAGVYCYLGGLVLDSAIIGNTTGEGDGGGVYLWGGTASNCTISGNTAYNGGGVYLRSDGTVHGCTISGNTANWRGGGAVMEDSDSVVRNCRILTNNAANDRGGGVHCVFNGVVVNCDILGNRALKRGGGIDGACAVRDCTIAANYVTYYLGYGGGIAGEPGAALVNSIVYFNTAPAAPNYSNDETSVTYSHSCTTPAVPGPGNIDAEPLFVELASNNVHLLAGSPCIDTGTNAAWMFTAVDVENMPRIVNRVVDMGAHELSNLSCNFTADITVGYCPLPVTFTAVVAGANTQGLHYAWDFQNDGVCDTNGPNLQTAAHTYEAGTYSVRLVVSNLAGEIAVRVRPNYIIAAIEKVYVAPNGGNVAPYADWATAARSIADAVTVANEGTQILLSNGVYTLTNQITLDKGVIITGAFGATTATVDGSNAVRCFMVNNGNAVIAAITIAHGFGADGGGVYLNGAGTVRNCIIVSNGVTSAGLNGGGGVFCNQGGLVEGCVLLRNAAGQYGKGGGVTFFKSGMARQCVIMANSSPSSGGGAYCTLGGTVQNCLVVSNTSDTGGGVATWGGTIENCTIAHNTATTRAGGLEANSANDVVRNTIVYYNVAPQNANYYNRSAFQCTYSCLTPAYAGAGNTTNAPGFAALPGDWRLAAGSPCYNTGANQPWMAGACDLAGNPRVLYGTVDMGAYEFVAGLWCDFTAAPVTAVVDQLVQFSGVVAGTNVQDLFYRWDFQLDGTNDIQGASNIVYWSYPEAGIYSARLATSNAVGEVAVAARTNCVVIVPEGGLLWLVIACIGAIAKWRAGVPRQSTRGVLL